MCCSCGGGRECTDTNNGALNSRSDNCSWYVGDESSCGDYDDDDFVAKEICCACNGGSSPVDPDEVLTEYTCSNLDNGAVDSGFDDCSWYDNHQGSCGEYDDDDFIADRMCCACVESNANEESCIHSSYGALDSRDDSCVWYATHEASCGDFDDDDFVASVMCCQCGGGITRTGDASAVGTCFSTSHGAGDSSENGCYWYTSSQDSCGAFDDDDFVASEMCCACGGGTSTDVYEYGEEVTIEYISRSEFVTSKEIWVLIFIFILICVIGCLFFCYLCKKQKHVDHTAHAIPERSIELSHQPSPVDQSDRDMVLSADLVEVHIPEDGTKM